MAWAAVDFPLPDSPARPKTSPGLISNEILSTAATGPLGVRYSTRRCSIESRSPAASVAAVRLRDSVCTAEDWGGANAGELDVVPLDAIRDLPLRAQAWIGDLVDTVVDEC